jgi:hypothetical protein
MASEYSFGFFKLFLETIFSLFTLNIFYCQVIIDNGSDTSYKLTSVLLFSLSVDIP